MVGRRKRGRRNRDRPDPASHGDGMGGQGDLLTGDDDERAPAEDDVAEEDEVAEEDVVGEKDVVAEERAEAGDQVEERPETEDRNEPEEPAEPEAPEPEDPVEARLRVARGLVSDGRIREAIDLYRALVSDHPDSLRARNNLGVLYDELGQHALALEQFEAAREIEPENVEVLTNLGASLGYVGRFEEAERELRRAQRLDPDAVDVRANLGILYFRRGLYAQAETELRWVCDRDHDHGPAHFYRGEALNRLGRVDDAMEVLERATHLQPDNSKAFYTLGILFDKKHMRQEAERMYRRARELARS